MDGQVENTAATGNGPVNAIDNALRKALEKFYPELKEVELLDYKVRVLGSKDGTGSVVRVLLVSTDGEEEWWTLGVSPNIIAASWRAMVDGLEYKLVKDGVEPHAPAPGSVTGRDRSRRSSSPGNSAVKNEQGRQS